MKIKSTKAWHKLPCAHAQFQDLEDDGSPGDCASWHGYDRSVILEFSGEIDDYGWVVPFGGLREVKKFVEYYFDHTAVMPANDPRKDQIKKWNEELVTQSLPSLFKLRVLPYGVSMEMSSLFIWEQVNPYVYSVTNGRAVVTKVTCIEHDSNNAFVEIPEQEALKQAKDVSQRGASYLVMKPEWEYKAPKSLSYFE